MVITHQVNEDEFVGGSSDRHDTTTQCNYLILKECVVYLGLGIIHLVELINAHSSVELVRIWVLSLVSQSLQVVLSVLDVLGRVLCFLFLYLCWSTSLLSCLLCCLFLFLLLLICILDPLLLSLVQLTTHVMLDNDHTSWRPSHQSLHLSEASCRPWFLPLLQCPQHPWVNFQS